MKCLKVYQKYRKSAKVVIDKRTKLFLYVFAGFLVINVPCITCNSEWTHQLSYDQIYNHTNFVQIRPYPSHSYIEETPISHSNNYFNGDNEIDYDRFKDYREGKKDKLVVGFARDPFRDSIPEEDYSNGVRDSSKSDRGKRGVVHLYNMIYCATGCDPLTYKGYGCYCGFSGSGRPTDGIDRCCQMHDLCYENIYCPFYTVYFQPYYWKCYRGSPLCALENYQTQSKVVNGCAARLCECDRLFAMCVRRYRCPSQRRPAPFCKSSPFRLLQNILRELGG